jgi:heptosyltransferase I
MRALILKTSSLGDVVQTFDVAQYLKEKQKFSEVDWIVEAPSKNLVEALPYVDTTWVVDTKNWRKMKNLSSFFTWKQAIRQKKYDVVFDLQGNIKSALLLSFVWGKDKVGFAKKDVAEWPNLLFTNIKYSLTDGLSIQEDYLCIVKKYFNDKEVFTSKALRLLTHDQEKNTLQKKQGVRNILVCPGSFWKNKKLSLQALTSLLNCLSHEEKSLFFLCWGTEEEKQEALEIQKKVEGEAIILDKLSLTDLHFFMCQMDLILAMDSLPLHLAGTTGVKTWGFFGPSSGKKYCLKKDNISFFQGTCPYHIENFEKTCGRLRSCKSGACLKNLDGSLLFKKLK